MISQYIKLYLLKTHKDFNECCKGRNRRHVYKSTFSIQFLKFKPELLGKTNKKVMTGKMKQANYFGLKIM